MILYGKPFWFSSLVPGGVSSMCVKTHSISLSFQVRKILYFSCPTLQNANGWETAMATAIDIGDGGG
jgi:hypothetical protein